MKGYFINRETASCIAVWGGFALLGFFLYLIKDNVASWVAWPLDVVAFVVSIVAGVAIYWIVIMFQVVLGIIRGDTRKCDELKENGERKSDLSTSLSGIANKQGLPIMVAEH